MIKKITKYLLILTIFTNLTFTMNKEFDESNNDNMTGKISITNNITSDPRFESKLDDFKKSNITSKKEAKRQAENEMNRLNDTNVDDEMMDIEDIDKAIDLSTQGVTKGKGAFGVFYNTSLDLAKVPIFIQSIKVAVYMTIINAITVMTSNIGERLSLYMGLFIAVFAALQLMWNAFMYYVKTTNQDQPVNLGGYMSQQIPYIIKVGIISAFLMTNLYWYIYAVLARNLFITLGGIFGNTPGATFELIAYKMITVMWIPVALILKSFFLPLLITPLFTGTYFFALFMGFMLMGLVGRAVTEFVVIVIEYMIVGVFSIIVLPFALLDFTRNYGGKVIGAMISAGVNLIIGTALICFLADMGRNLNITFWSLIANPGEAYFGLLMLFILIVLTTKAKTIGNFITRGQGASVKGSELVTEGIMAVTNAIASIVSIATLATGIGSAVGAAQAAATIAAQAAATKAAEVAAKEVAKKAANEAVKETAKTVAKEGGKAAVKEGVKNVGKDAAKEAFKTTLKNSLRATGKNMMNRRMQTQMVGNIVKNLQQNDGGGSLKAIADIGSAIARNQLAQAPMGNVAVNAIEGASEGAMSAVDGVASTVSEGMSSVASEVGSNLEESIGKGVANVGLDIANKTVHNTVGDDI